MNDRASSPRRASTAGLSTPWGLLDVFAAILVAAIGILALNVAALAASLALKIPLEKNGGALAAFVIVQDAMLVGAAWLFALARHRVGWDRLGLRRFDTGLGCGLSAALLFGSYVIRICYAAAAMALGAKLEPQAVLSHLDTSEGGIWLTLIVAGLLGPIAEEVFFRGFVYGGMRARLGVGGALLSSTMLFTLLHFSLDQFIPIFVLGVFLAWLYERTGSLYPGMLLHIANNTISLALLFALTAAGRLPG